LTSRFFIGHRRAADGSTIGGDTPAVSSVAVALNLRSTQHTNRKSAKAKAGTASLKMKELEKREQFRFEWEKGAILAKCSKKEFMANLN